MLDITNDIALKYHIEFGAPKCKVLKIGPGKKAKITLNQTDLEYVKTYKYLGVIFNNRNNLKEHIDELEKKSKQSSCQ